MTPRTSALLCITALAASCAAPVDDLDVAPAAQALTEAPPAITAGQAYLLDPTTGAGLYDQPGAAEDPWSLVKLMTMRLVLEAVDDGLMDLDDTVEMSAYSTSLGCTCWTHPSASAAGVGPQLAPGSTMDVDTALYGIAMSTAEPTTSLAELVANLRVNGVHDTGDSTLDSLVLLAGFVSMMNDEADELGLDDTHFENIHGGPAGGQVSTAEDMARLWASIVEDFPHALDYLGVRSRTVTFTNPAATPTTQTITINKVYDYYFHAQGDKNGGSGGERENLVAQAERLGRPLVYSHFHPPGMNLSARGDTTAMLRWGFAEIFRPQREASSSSYAASTVDQAIDCASQYGVFSASVHANLAIARFYSTDEGESYLSASSTLFLPGNEPQRVDVQAISPTRAIIAVQRLVSSSGWWPLHEVTLHDVRMPIWGGGLYIAATYSLGNARYPSVARAGTDRVAVSYTDRFGNTRLATLDADPSGGFTLLDAIDTGLNSSQHELADLGGGNQLVLIARNGGNLTLQSHHETSAGALSVSHTYSSGGVSDVSIEAVGLAPSFQTSRYAIGFVLTDGDGKVGFVDVDPFGSITRVSDGNATMRTPYAVDSFVVAPIDHPHPDGRGVVTAQSRASDGALRLSVIEADRFGDAQVASDSHITDSGAQAGSVTEPDICRLTGADGSGRYVTSMITTSGALKLIAWSVAD